jgi:hypothetical protein
LSTLIYASTTLFPVFNRRRRNKLLQRKLCAIISNDDDNHNHNSGEGLEVIRFQAHLEEEENFPFPRKKTNIIISSSVNFEDNEKHIKFKLFIAKSMMAFEWRSKEEFLHKCVFIETFSLKNKININFPSRISW